MYAIRSYYGRARLRRNPSVYFFEPSALNEIRKVASHGIHGYVKVLAKLLQWGCTLIQHVLFHVVESIQSHLIFLSLQRQSYKLSASKCHIFIRLIISDFDTLYILFWGTNEWFWNKRVDFLIESENRDVSYRRFFRSRCGCFPHPANPSIPDETARLRPCCHTRFAWVLRECAADQSRLRSYNFV